jgi:hypothetical protein
MISPVWDAKNPIVPFDDNDNMLDFPLYGPNKRWEEFGHKGIRQLELKLDSYTRGRSSATFWWTDEVGRRYPMFLTDLEDVIRNEKINFGVVGGLWTATKRGQNFGIKRVS